MVKEINPKIIVLLGKTASDNVPRNPKYKYLHIIHPSAAMRFTKPRIKFLEGMQKLKTFVTKNQIWITYMAHTARFVSAKHWKK